ncbi:MAG: biotin transporter BioY [Actinobacteria bacterium]|nr:biotin transporter BioY [Actinomycetota bacterium]MCL6086999.1 biotin transporter BioY [Actinomycetota bacterium]
MKNINDGLAVKSHENIINKNNILIKLIFTFAFAFTMAISANIFIYIPVTPVPITLQTLTVLFSGILLGSRFALISQIEYLLLGIAGFPVFAGFKSGIAVFSGPTGGYLIGFVLAAYICGFIFENYRERMKDKIYLSFIACLAGLSLIYFLGFIHLFGYLSVISGNTLTGSLVLKTFDLAVKPFILVDFIKIFIIVNSAALWQLNYKISFRNNN